VRNLYHENVQGQQANIVAFIVDHMLDTGSKYPRAVRKSLKRKREEEELEVRKEEDELMKKFMADNREAVDAQYRTNA
jgi:hypothetical protein